MKINVENFVNKIVICLVSIIITLFVFEIIFQCREQTIGRLDDKLNGGNNAGRSFDLHAEDMADTPFFNGCLMSQGIMAKDAELGYVNIPNVDGFSVRVYDRPNLVVKSSYDFSSLTRQGLRFESAPFHINNLGNRGPDMLLEKPSKVFRIVFLGDSITFGYYVAEEDTFVCRVKKELESGGMPDYKIQVINAGVSSLNAAQVFAHLKNRALLWSPDLIVWSFYVNDVSDKANAEEDVLFPVRNAGWVRFLHQYAFGRFVEKRIFSTKIGAQLGIDENNPETQRVAEGWQIVGNKLAQARSLLDERRIPLVVVIFPCAVQFSNPWTKPQYQEKLKKLCEKLDIPCIDLLPLLEKEGNADNLYYRGDSIHPNARGHAIAAKAISDFFKSNPYYLVNKGGGTSASFK